jgi:glycosyltransferase involved in cell wall biosynthesis
MAEQVTGRSTNVAILLSEGLAARGGIGRVMAYLVRALDTVAPDVSVRVVRARLIEHGAAKHPSVLPALAGFALRLARGGVDLVHVNVAPRGSTWRKMLFAGVARRMGVPVLLHLHGSGYDQFFAAQSPVRQARIRAFFGAAAGVVALSDYWHRFVTETLRVDPARVTQIPNGVPAHPERTAAVPAVPEAPTRILFLGQLGERKGVDVLLDALATLDARGLAWRATLGGNGEVEAAQARAAALGIGDRIAFPGWVGEAEVRTLLGAADLFVLPSRAENQPVAILEAMAAGLPVVATAIGAIPEQVLDGETGLLVPPGDAAALADALATLIDSPARRAAMGAAGHARFAAHFSIEATAERFAALYRRLARSR